MIRLSFPKLTIHGNNNTTQITQTLKNKYLKIPKQ